MRAAALKRGQKFMSEYFCQAPSVHHFSIKVDSIVTITGTG
jgi:hypothetical protein